MGQKWEELESAAERAKKSYEKYRTNMPHSERVQMERDIRLMQETAKRERDSYVHWLWGR